MILDLALWVKKDVLIMYYLVGVDANIVPEGDQI